MRPFTAKALLEVSKKRWPLSVPCVVMAPPYRRPMTFAEIERDLAGALKVTLERAT